MTSAWLTSIGETENRASIAQITIRFVNRAAGRGELGDPATGTVIGVVTVQQNLSVRVTIQKSICEFEEILEVIS
jgi:hypothetical protein